MAAEKTVKEMINDFFKNIGGDTNELAKELRKLDSKYMYRDGKTRTKLKAQARANMKKNQESNKGSKKNKKVDRSSYTKPEKNTAGLKATTTESPLASLTKTSKNKKKVKNVNPDDGFPRPKNIKIPKGSTLSGLAKEYGTTVKIL